MVTTLWVFYECHIGLSECVYVCVMGGAKDRALTMTWLCSKHMGHVFFVCLVLYVLVTSRFVWEWAPTCHSMRSLWLYIVASLGNQIADTRPISHSLTLSRYCTNQSQSFLLMPSVKPSSDKYNFGKLLVWFDWDSNPQLLSRDQTGWLNE